MSLRKLCAFILCGMTVCGAFDTFAATTKKAAKQSAIQKGTSVRAKMDASGIYDEQCYNDYFGCMDQFCNLDNADGGTCACSDTNAKLEKELASIATIIAEAERIKTIEVERVQAGANADIIFNGERRYDEQGNVIKSNELTAAEKKAKRRESLLAMFEKTDDADDDNVFDDVDGNIADKTGTALYNAADALCKDQISDSCSKDYTFLRQLYARQITSDCKGFENTIAEKKAAADQELAQAQADVRAAQKETLSAANKYDLGECMIEFKKCMQKDEACGKDWINCVSTIASENMQNNTTISTAGTKVATIDKYDITASTMEILDAKRAMCERVLDQCVAVRNEVWPAFLRESAPTIKVAESKAESKFRQSCLSSIATCIQTACKDDIVGKGVDTMDACLARPDMARSFCKVEIDPCERMEPLIWGYVKDKLAAMRVDACTQEVKDCFTADTRCGSDFSNCIGMDYEYIHDICPLDSLVVCKANNPEFSMSDLDSMLMGLYLNIDNAALDTCQNLVDAKMAEVCGSTTDCNKFAADDTIGTGSLQSQKDGTVYRVTGMISFGSIKMGDGVNKISNGTNAKGKPVYLGAGEIGVAEYLEHVYDTNANTSRNASIISSIEAELNNIAGTINRVVQLIEQDQEIQYCIKGRDLSQITGKKGQKTTARFPNLLNSVKQQIAVAALRKAQDNYNAKWNKEVAEASKNASADIAQYMCQMLPQTNGGASARGTSNVKTTLTAPYAISYEVGSGVDNNMLIAAAGHSEKATSQAASLDNSAGTTEASRFLDSLLVQGSNAVKVELPGGTREMWSVFNRETRVCHYCTSTVTKHCKSENSKGFLGIGNKQNLDCEESAPVENCQDIPM